LTVDVQSGVDAMAAEIRALLTASAATLNGNSRKIRLAALAEVAAGVLREPQETA
jgi:hypothetical protein